MNEKHLVQTSFSHSPFSVIFKFVTNLSNPFPRFTLFVHPKAKVLQYKLVVHNALIVASIVAIKCDYSCRSDISELTTNYDPVSTM